MNFSRRKPRSVDSHPSPIIQSDLKTTQELRVPADMAITGLRMRWRLSDQVKVLEDGFDSPDGMEIEIAGSHETT